MMTETTFDVCGRVSQRQQGLNTCGGNNRSEQHLSTNLDRISNGFCRSTDDTFIAKDKLQSAVSSDKLITSTDLYNM